MNHQSDDSGNPGNDIENQERVHGFLDGSARSDDSSAIKRGDDVRNRLRSKFAKREQLIRSASHHENPDAAVQTS
ncbi:hypothetical protein [Burkholderia ambifaria]|uniref:hypothetical protein n=1 Tax=Burkholderia ambifaria TaxID=152480 RepID=UPI00158A3987|nr:hypothetical protein [Burkholderia ambifaria]MBR8344696.1 hypothetical protein [Burkholderia ambifaria]